MSDGGLLTVGQLRQIRASLTWGDQRYGRVEAGDDASDATPHAMHRAARRLGLVAADSTLDDFMDRVQIEELNEVLTEDRHPTSAASET